MSDRDLMSLRATLIEMRSAEVKHGDCYIGNLRAIRNSRENGSVDLHDQDRMLELVRELHAVAKAICEGPEPSRAAVLAEECCEALEDALVGKDATEELIQVAAMALGWLDVDYETALVRLRRHEPGTIADTAMHCCTAGANALSLEQRVEVAKIARDEVYEVLSKVARQS